MTPTLLQLIWEKNNAYRQWRNSNSVADYSFFAQLRRQQKQDIQVTKRQHVENEFGDIRTPGDFWRKHRRFEPENRNIPPLIDEQGNFYSSSVEIADALYESFIKNFNQNWGIPYRLPAPIHDDLNDDPADYAVSEIFVRRQLSTVRLHGAPGVDGITPPILRNIATSISPALTALISRSIEE